MPDIHRPVHMTDQPERTETDLAESARDKRELRPDTATMDLPDVKDIPGQERVRPLIINDAVDVTAASVDEEGTGLLDDDNDDDSNVTDEERKDLDESASNLPTRDDTSIRRATLDDRDQDGDPLNEAGFDDAVSGSDLDIPEEEEEDTNRGIGEEDEENDVYSLGGEDHDQGDSKE